MPHMHINLFIQGRGHHEAAWRHPKSSALPLTDIRYTVELAQKAEASLFDSIFLADVLGLWNDVESTPFNWLEPITALAAVAMATRRIGLIATCSTTYTEPYNLARQFASLDHISGGRAGWNIVTTWSPQAGANFGHIGQVGHADRYERAEEFMTVVKGLWDSWADDAVLDDRAGGRYADRTRVKAIDHKGPHFPVVGPLNMPRAPQGRPVFVQAGSSDTGKKFAARHAEAVFTAHLDQGAAKAFYADLKGLVAAEGRDPRHVVILPGINPVIGSTEAEAARYEAELNELSDPEVGRHRLSQRFGGHDFSQLPLDAPLSVDDFPDPSKNEASRSRTEAVVALVKKERPTLRQLLAKLAGARGHFTAAGSPEMIADIMQDWFETGAADGFNLMPPVLPHQLDLFISEVVPLLRKRGLFRDAYEGETLRSHFGLSRPVGWI
ncbi:LLM class flavin-dependent oxidoreductase [Bradyrhizobium erythrophlei]|jgi:FMN-dependent oxidoreductase (nitrilotriacetate monooxygenase family)|uniref:FMN-dependent oxidoreductase, nitrilotriacetate monooxygenase family n=1 Tax=Bradyrhizobium erythrophlei TaxID=1437360 RepID=A0A1M7TYY5_9BRAD|nr:LLM class flavin-dependent oxidoreductase [Bradyrhizobium erythrophlei]SHN75873.1 FMN-dependent oxidoreductase, nitrilotriacetate monooxygenase family [Bradyrhizobium erythrophlei]